MFSSFVGATHTIRFFPRNMSVFPLPAFPSSWPNPNCALIGSSRSKELAWYESQLRDICIKIFFFFSVSMLYFLVDLKTIWWLLKNVFYIAHQVLLYTPATGNGHLFEWVAWERVKCDFLFDGFCCHGDSNNTGLQVSCFQSVRLWWKWVEHLKTTGGGGSLS